jgi:hypothetical protein
MSDDILESASDDLTEARAKIQATRAALLGVQGDHPERFGTRSPGWSVWRPRWRRWSGWWRVRLQSRGQLLEVRERVAAAQVVGSVSPPPRRPDAAGKRLT